MAAPASRNNARRDFYERIGGLSMAPLWESLHQLVPSQPAPKYQPASWDYDKVRPFLMESGTLITAKEAVRRVLILENPAMPGSACITEARVRAQLGGAPEADLPRYLRHGDRVTIAPAQ